MRFTSKGLIPTTIVSLLAASVGIASGSTIWIRSVLPTIVAVQVEDDASEAAVEDGLAVPPPPEPRVQPRAQNKTIVSSDKFLPAEILELETDYLGTREASVATASLIARGTVTGSAKTGPGGIAQIPVTQNHVRYTLAVAGPNGYATHGVDVSRLRIADDHPVPLSTVLAAPQDLAFIRLKARSVPTSGYPTGGKRIGDLDGLVNGHTPSGTVIPLDARGDVSGIIAIPEGSELRAADGMDVWFLRNGEIMATSRTDEFGKYVVPGLLPGFYSFLATGRYGMVVCGIEIVEATEEANTVTQAFGVSGPLYDVAIGSNQIAVLNPTPPGDIPTALQSLANATGTGDGAGTPASPPGGGLGGGGAGGASGGGGGAGGAGLLGAALAGGALGAALADDDDDTPVSPAAP